MVEEENLRDSMAFKEYSTGERSKIKHPWITIVISGILVSVAMVLTNLLAVALHANPFSFNLILGLYGIPAGFACAWKNKTLSAITSLRYSSYSALIATATYFLISLIMLLISPTNAVGAILSIGSLVIACLILAVFFICVTFAAGAMVGTIALGVRDSKG
ncbi:MAG: hypothetical protein GNW80_02125 [Asgard group archaeon]|nr:hypothetical protein [Asgard group archaeon]